MSATSKPDETVSDLPPSTDKDTKDETQQTTDSNSNKGKKRSLDDLLNENKDYSNMTEMDLELKEFSCPRCSKIFTTTNDLFVHMRESYPDPTTCHLCGKNLNCMANVLSHSYLHLGIKPYKCPKCKYATRTRFNLRVHFGSCAKVEKFSYKRGNAQKKRKLNNEHKGRRNNKRNNNKSSSSRKKDAFIVNDNNNHDQNINQLQVYDDILYQLNDIGPAPLNRNKTCLIEVHIQHFPRISTDQFYNQQKQEINTNHANGAIANNAGLPPQVTNTNINEIKNIHPNDIAQFYADQNQQQQQTQQQQWQMSSFNTNATQQQQQ